MHKIFLTSLYQFSSMRILWIMIVTTQPITIKSISLSTKTTTSTNASHLFKIKPITEISSIDFDPYAHYFHNRKNNINNNKILYETPVLIKNAISLNECEHICDTIFEQSNDYYVDLQCKKRNKKEMTTDIIHCTLNDAFDYMMESKHEKSYFSFCEGLFDDDNPMMMLLNEAKEKLFQNHKSTSQDMFTHFPSQAKPTDCIVLAGEGATSTLHRDPFEWTGTSLCLEGSKIWRFIAPPGALVDEFDDSSSSGVHEIDNLLNSYRLPSMAWHDDNNDDESSNHDNIQYLSAGWQSDYSLYESRNDDKVPSAKYFSKMEEEDIKMKYKKISSISEDIDALRPSPKILNSDATVYTVVQKPGDLLIIPAYWWHQTYALEPSLAIASQRCAFDRDFPRVIKHILQTALDDDDIDIFKLLKIKNFNNIDDNFSSKDIVNELFLLLNLQI